MEPHIAFTIRAVVAVVAFLICVHKAVTAANAISASRTVWHVALVATAIAQAKCAAVAFLIPYIDAVVADRVAAQLPHRFVRIPAGAALAGVIATFAAVAFLYIGAIILL